jgi:hypothetical protein
VRRAVGLSSIVLAGAIALAACGGGSDALSASRPCVVETDEMAAMLAVDEVIAAPQKNGYECLYASQGQAIVALSLRTQAQFEAERARFEDKGVLLPELVPVDGFEGDASIDPRYNSLNVSAQGLVVSVELVGPAPADQEEQVDLETRIARGALEQL